MKLVAHIWKNRGSFGTGRLFDGEPVLSWSKVEPLVIAVRNSIGAEVEGYKKEAELEYALKRKKKATE